MAVEDWGGLEGFPNYEVSTVGRVRHAKTKRVRKPWREDSGHLTVSLQNSGEKMKRVKIHRLMALTFLDNPDNLPFVRHLNDVPDDNRIGNLAWGTNSDNQKDSIRNGTHFGSSKTHCPENHPYDEDNTSVRGKSRVCRKCEASRARSKRSEKKLPKGDPRHGTTNGYVNYGCRCGDCTVAGHLHSRKMYEKRKLVLNSKRNSERED